MESRLNSCNALLYGMSHCNLLKLQHIQNIVTRVIIMAVPRRMHIDDLLTKLHWLLVKYKVNFKIVTLMFKTLSHGQLKYLSELLHPKLCSRATRSADQRLIQVQRSQIDTFISVPNLHSNNMEQSTAHNHL